MPRREPRQPETPSTGQRRRVSPERGEIRGDVRALIAQTAARLIAEGLTDYHAAKLKAARQLGIADSHSLPDNHEIEAALRLHFALFSSEKQAAALAALRAVALELMVQLQEFAPWICGPVLTGTANEFSEIELELVEVEPKVFEMYLLNRGVEFDVESVRPAKSEQGHAHSVPRYSLEYRGAPVSISLFEHHAARQSAHRPDSLRHARAQHLEAVKLFSDLNIIP